MLKRIQKLYQQRGHMFYRDGLTYNQHAAGAFWFSYYYQEVPDKSNLVLASTFHNLGSMMDKYTNYSATSHYLFMYGLPQSVWRPVSMLDMARNYLYTTDEQYKKLLTPNLAGKVSLLTERELFYFQQQPYAETALQVALNDVSSGSKVLLTERQWEILEGCLVDIFNSK